MVDVLLDALLDSLKVLPFLLAIYIIIELVEDKTIVLFKKQQVKTKNMGPILGASFGIIPQCGFGVVATNLFSKKYITIGTLLAIYIATSDEAIPIIISNPSYIDKLLPLIAIKFIYAVLIGYVVDFIYRKKVIVTNSEEILKEETEHGCCHHDLGHGEETKFRKYILHPLIHSLKIFIYILVVNLILGFAIYLIGEDNLSLFLNKSCYFQPVFSTIIGLIPNCASSVVITQLYVSDSLTFGATLAGLCVNAGLGFALLFKENKNIKENLVIVAIMVLVSLILGYLITIIG